MGKGQKRDLTGKVFGYLTVIGDSGLRTTKGEIKWTCECICGQKVNVVGGNLTRKKGEQFHAVVKNLEEKQKSLKA